VAAASAATAALDYPNGNGRRAWQNRPSIQFLQLSFWEAPRWRPRRHKFWRKHVIFGVFVLNLPMALDEKLNQFSIEY